MKFLMLTKLFSTNFVQAKNLKRIKNNYLQTIKADFSGNIMQNGLFENLYPRDKKPRSLMEVLHSKLFRDNPYQAEKKNDTFKMKVIEDKKLLNTKEDFICWLGHATFLIQVNGKRMITDPCLTAPPFITRHTKLPISMEELKPHYILVSHGHFDHLDADTVKHFNDAKALIPLNMSETIKGYNQTIRTQEAGWFQKYEVDEDFEVYFLPSHHWHRRTLSDTNEVLWGSFVIKTQKETIYFAGDTAYSSHFKDIAELFDIDKAILPIGAYEPREIMKEMHMNPEEALQAFNDLGAREMIPMHYGTFDLTDEPMGEAPKALMKYVRDEKIQFLEIGERYMSRS
ncbi:MAG: Outer membrane protein romA [uncultured Sulfurovum sp.]|uniref:Outer membrane protein romA n=1 Tax=uncultured Sulfurovum sp. TaxID=269237 RepID=A0A6S6SKQ5_9BACT|nr:MAG: Outer membrane protein romA [uncultured Sulfurovum sp.]